ncbi:E3 ubiquitin-protein ligase RSL1-like [Lycium ferocissimum]|uniref:E3 ubiquitin-protein ligase RSL1-like n=1 Tax=Lycium ferocissimum TaxID=112874 RepID=UPI002815B416|nr:E3 ubiquitin-protein ligase RSL1-like [Lycium ferocissimum]
MALPSLISDAECAAELQMQYILEDSLTSRNNALARREEELYCPNKRCSKFLILHPVEGIIMNICPWCKGPFCTQCRVPWHTGRNCDEFQKEEKDRENDIRVKLLAEDRKWKNCPHCNSLVEKVDGCMHITCSCKEQFCYACGETWSERHWNC